MHTKKCIKCNKEKLLSEYYKDASLLGGLRQDCKACKNSATEVWRKKNRVKYNESQRNYNKNNYSRLRLQRYKLTLQNYEKMLLEQHNQCAICHKHPNGKRPLAVDHDHKTGKVRGLLCYGCNRALYILDNKNLLNKALDYLKKQ